MQTSFLTEHDQSPTYRLSKTQDAFKPSCVQVFNSLLCHIKERYTVCWVSSAQGWLNSNPFCWLKELGVVESGKYRKDQRPLKKKIIIFFKQFQNMSRPMDKE